jgi:hypothetical protein
MGWGCGKALEGKNEDEMVGFGRRLVNLIYLLRIWAWRVWGGVEIWEHGDVFFGDILMLIFKSVFKKTTHRSH